MGDLGICIVIILFFISFFMFLNLWFEELLNLKFTCQLYLAITYIAIKWCFYLGSKGYTIAYSSSRDETGVKHFIEFPVIWM